MVPAHFYGCLAAFAKVPAHFRGGRTVAIFLEWVEKFMKNHLILALGALFAISLSAEECAHVVAELQSMRQAQITIHSSLVTNHEMFATSLESYSEALSETAGRVHKTVSENMSSNAHSFRERGLKAQKMAQKLDSATASLIQKVSRCIK